MSYDTFIGLEIHIHLLTKTKAFCSCKAHFGDEPNTNVCPVCMGYPGVLPQVNEEALFMGYKVARALNCNLTRNTIFERKNYFYPDMPKNYQISQFASPLGTKGFKEFECGGEKRRLNITECHLEEDAGKMIHAGDMSLIDYNRAGYSLLEIVTEPDLKAPEEAEAFLHEFRRMVRYLGVCDGNMEEGSLRCDANVSINDPGKGLGVKVEVKNLNSSRFVRKALAYEIERQSEMKTEGKKITQETRLWNENRDVTETMRKKESSHDYRFFPEPDLPPFRPTEEFLAKVESAMIELPFAKRNRLIEKFQLTAEQADFIAEEKITADYFERCIALEADAQAVATWLCSDVKGQLNRLSLDIASSPLTPERLASIIVMLKSGRIHSKIAKQLLVAVFDEGKDPEAIIKEKGWEQIVDPKKIEEIVAGVFDREAESVASIKAGNQKAMGFLFGEAMKACEGRAEPGALKKAIAAMLERSPA